MLLSAFLSLLFSVPPFCLVLGALQVEQKRRVGEEGERDAYGTFTPDMLRAPPVQSFYTSSFHRDNVFSRSAVDDSRPARAAKIAV
jgi:hypothetical protein